MTVHGVKLLYPFSAAKCVFPLEVNNPHRYRLQTGSKGDRALAMIFLVGCIPTFLIAHQGYERFIRSAQQSIEAAVRDYNEFSKDHLVMARINSYNMLTKEPLIGTVEIVGAINPHTLVFKDTDRHLHTIGKPFQADYVAEDISCLKASRSRSFIRTVDMSNQLLAGITSYVNPAREDYCFGDLTTSDRVSLPQGIKVFSPITGTGNTIKLNYATINDIRSFNLDYAFITKGILTIKSNLVEDSVDSKNEFSQKPIMPDTYAQVSCLLNPKETLKFHKEKGDTVRENDVIASKTISQVFEVQISLNDDKQAALDNQRAVALADIDQKIVSADQTVRIDSAEYEQARELVKRMYVSDLTLEDQKLKLQKGRRVLHQLVSSRSVLQRKLALEIRKLQVANVQLTAKAKAFERASAIRSPVSGVIKDIREALLDNKTRVTFVIKRFN